MEEEAVEEAINDPETPTAHGNVAEEEMEEGDYMEEEDTMEEGAMFSPETIQAAMDAINAVPGVELGASAVLNILKSLAVGVPALGVLGGAAAASRADKKDAMKSSEELEEALTTIEALQEDLNETNLLNAKLLYLNKIFKSNNLTESQKANTIASFDKAETVKEVKLVFETVSENLTVNTTTKPMNEVKGMASKAVGNAPKKPEIITEANSVVARMQKLAGIIK